MNKIERLKTKYPWLDVNYIGENYIESKYYDKLLKKYSFNDQEDLKIFSDFLHTIGKNQNNILEIGSGTGRCANILKDLVSFKSITLLDLSISMLDNLKNKIGGNDKINFIHSDALNYLKDTKEVYDLIYCLWSLSHSIHQSMEKYGVSIGKKHAETIIKKFIMNNMALESKMFLIHFDSLSEEQIILRKILNLIYPFYYQKNKQSLSKQCIDEVLNELVKMKVIKVELEHKIGDPIIYRNLNEALETFVNFHLESYFNDRPELPRVIDKLSTYFKAFTLPNGNISIKPGCFVYKINRIV
jgi:hypothetical protein